MRELFLQHLYSGHLFFTGAAILIAGAFMPRRRAGVLLLLGTALAAFSGTPVPALLALALLVAIGTLLFARRARRLIALVTAALTLAACANEVPYHLVRPHVAAPARLYVVGDSLASGGFGETRTWPEILGRTAGAHVVNLALPSDTAATATQSQLPELEAQLRSHPASDPACVIVEVGGNDMLEGASISEYERGLEAIVAAARRHRHPVIVLELPLIPGRWRYGAVQRDVARRHGATLAPKRILAGVLVDPPNTSDGIHLTQRGHDALARELARWLDWPNGGGRSSRPAPESRRAPIPR